MLFFSVVGANQIGNRDCKDERTLIAVEKVIKREERGRGQEKRVRQKKKDVVVSFFSILFSFPKHRFAGFFRGPGISIHTVRHCVVVYLCNYGVLHPWMTKLVISDVLFRK